MQNVFISCVSDDMFDVTTAFYEGEYAFGDLGCQEEVEEMTEQREDMQ